MSSSYKGLVKTMCENFNSISQVTFKIQCITGWVALERITLRMCWALAIIDDIEWRIG